MRPPILLYSYIQNPVLQLTADLKIVAFIPENAPLFGYASLINRKITSLLSAKDKKEFTASIIALTQSRKKNSTVELAIKHADESLNWYSVEIKKASPKDDFDGFIIALKNIHHQKIKQQKAEEKLATLTGEIEQWKAACKLKETIINNTKSIIVSLDSKGNILHFNKMAEQLSGYKKEQVLGKNGFSLFIPKSHYPNLNKSLTQSLRQGLLDDYFESPSITKKGKEVIIAWRTTYLTSNTSNISTVHVGRDITDKILQDKKVEESEERFRLLAETLPVPIMSIDRKGKIIFLNKQFTQLLGYTINDLPNVQTIFKLLYNTPEGRQAAEKRWKRDSAFTNADTDKEVVTLTVVCKDSSLKTFEKTGWQIGDYLYNFYIDITYRIKIENELVIARDRFKHIAENIPIAIASYDQNKDLIFLNKTFTNTLGYTIDDIKQFDKWFSHFVFENEDGRDAFTKKWIEKITALHKDNGFQFLPEEVSIQSKNGAIIHFEVSVSVEDDCVYGLFNNITERKAVEQKLLKSEQRFRQMAEHTPLPIGCYNFNMELVFLNRRFTEILGFELEEVRPFDKWFGQFVFADEATKLRKMQEWDAAIQFQKRNPNLTAPLSERQIRCKDGTVRTFEISFSIEETFVYGLFNDITERKKTEQLLIESEQRFKSIADNTPIPICIFDEGQNITYINKKFLYTMGYSYSEVASGESWPRYIVYKNEEDRINGRDEWLDVIANQKHKLSHTDYMLERTILCKDGKEKIFTIHFTVRNNLVYTILNDITERKNAETQLHESEQRFKALAENMPIAIGSHHINGGVMFLNKFFKTSLGYTQKDIPTLEHWYKKTQPDAEIRKLLYDHWLQTVAAYRRGEIKKTPYIETQVLCKDGSFRTYNFLFSIHKDIVYIMLVDITERRRAEQELIASHQQLRQLTSHLQQVREEERKHVAREIHDELGQLITGLKMDVSMIKKRTTKQMPELNEKFTEVLDLTDTLVKSVRRIASELRPSILDDIGLGAALEWQSREFEKRTQLKCNFENMAGDIEVPFDVKSNLFRIYQESLTNIIRHAQATVITSYLKINNQLLELSIKDNGKGFNTKNLTKTLGLLGMKERAIMINGIFTIESNAGSGTAITIRVILP